MNIVILHCHYERGGVTQVVENHVRSLRDSSWVDQIVLAGGERFGGLSEQTRKSVELISIPDFDYDSTVADAESLDQRSDAICRALCDQLAQRGISADNAILHWHNHSLGKNTAAPAVIRNLAEGGWRLLLQIHDFAEDNRPENYQRLIAASGASDKTDLDSYLYPVAAQIRFATLTRGDALTLVRLGVPEHQSHCLPNSVVRPSEDPLDRGEALDRVRTAMNLPADARWCLYPVRGIRRKNVGEFLLLSRWTGENQYSGLTLCPATPVERRSYERWKALSATVAPRAVFDAGQHPQVSFQDNLSAAAFVVSTSVAEGFGMAFLEPWLVHREVLARRLPTVTDDFEACGVKLPKLYDAIPIPGDPAWVFQCTAESAKAMQDAWAQVPESFRPTFESGPQGSADSVDFAVLTPRRQVGVLQRAATDAGFEATIKQHSMQLVQDLARAADDSLYVHNARVVGQEYSPQNLGKRLLAIYESLSGEAIDSQVRAPAKAGCGVDLIARARPYFPCRTEVLDE